MTKTQKSAPEPEKPTKKYRPTLIIEEDTAAAFERDIAIGFGRKGTDDYIVAAMTEFLTDNANWDKFRKAYMVKHNVLDTNKQRRE